jgi:DNA-binding transcriptional LysR family regulator
MKSPLDTSLDDPEAFVLRRLSLRHLRVLAALADGGSISAAAERLHVTQPAVSKALAELERDLGFTLFARRGRNVQLLAVGDRLVTLARRIDQELQRGGADVAAMVRGAQGHLVIGATNAVLSRLLPTAVAAFKLEQPLVTISVRSNALKEMWESLRQGQLDVVVARLPDDERPRDLRAHVLGPAREVVVMSLNHPLAARRQVDWELLAAQSWIWPLPGTRTRLLQDRFFHRLGLPLPSNVVETGDTALMLALLRRLPLVALLPEDSALAAAQAGLAKMLPLQAAIGLPQVAAWHLPQPAGPALKRFLQLLAAA